MRAPVTDQSLPVGSFLRELLLGACQEIETADAAARQSAVATGVYDPEAIRKLRLSIRRINYQLQALNDAEKVLGAKPLLRRLRVIGRPFGALRDAQILEQRVAEALGKRRGAKVRQIQKRAAAYRRQKEGPVYDAIEGGATGLAITLLNDYRRALPFQTWLLGDARPLGRRVLRRSRRRLERLARRARRRPSNENLHELRIAAKHTMYVAQAFARVLGPAATEFADLLNTLQQTLGRQHDYVVVRAWLKRTGKRHRPLRPMTKKLARYENRRAGQLAEEWVRHWRPIQRFDQKRLG